VPSDDNDDDDDDDDDEEEVRYGRNNSTKFPALGATNVRLDVTNRECARSRVRVDQCVSAYVAAAIT
jgi:hypothetical protein